VANIEKLFREPCDRCGHRYAKHAPKRGDGRKCCDCPGWKATPGDQVMWRARWVDPLGNRKEKWFSRQVVAEDHLVEIEHAKRTGGYVDPAAGKAKVGPLAERWYNTTVTLRPSTRHTYRQLLDNQILPRFERASLRNLDTLVIKEWIAWMVTSGGRGGKPLSPSRVRNAHQVLCQILDVAIEGKMLAANPAKGVGLPAIIEREMHFLTAVEVEQLADTIAAPYGLLILFAAWTGLRPGELATVKVRRLDLLRGTCEVAETVAEVDGKLIWGPTKTHERRTIRLPGWLCQEVGAYLAGRSLGRDDVLFTMPQGGVLRESKFLEQIFHPAAARAGLPKDLRMHDLRHTAASLMIREGASIKAVQKVLGHKSATVTLDRYGHLYPDELEDLARRLDEARRRAQQVPGRGLRGGNEGTTVLQISKTAGQ
jgi:integrase